MARIVADLPDISSVMLIDRSGTPIASAKVFPIPRTLDFRGDTFFRALEGQPRGNFR